MNNFNEPNSKEEQQEFNKDFLIKFTVFMFFYRAYIMHIDKKGTIINCAEDFLANKKFEDLIVDELD